MVEEILDIIKGNIYSLRYIWTQNPEEMVIIITSKRIICVTNHILSSIIKKLVPQQNESEKLDSLKEKLLHSLNEKRWYESGFEINTNDVSKIYLKEFVTHDGFIKIKTKTGKKFKLRIDFGGTASFDMICNAMKDILPESLDIKRNVWW